MNVGMRANLLRDLGVLWALVATGVGPAHAGKGDVPVPRLPKSQCAIFLKQLQKMSDEDNALLPFIRAALAEIYGVLNVSGLDDAARVKNLVAADTRGFAYQLEGLGKALRKLDEDRYRLLRESGTTLENAIGDYIFETELWEYLGEDPELAKLVTPKISGFFQGRILGQHDRLNQTLHREGWIEGSKAYGTIMDVVQDSKEVLGKKTQLEKKILAAMAKELRKTHAELVGGELNPREIEDGIHKLRRELRQIPILVLTFPGLFYLDEGLKVNGVVVNPDDHLNKFVPDESNLAKHAAGLSKDGYLYLGSVVRKLGKLKGDNGLKLFLYQKLTAAAAELGAEAKPLLRAVSPTGPSKDSFEKTYQAAMALFQEIRDSQILLQLADQFEAAKDQL